MRPYYGADGIDWTTRCGGGIACPNFAGHLPLGDHGWYHRVQPGCTVALPVVARPASPLQLTLDIGGAA